MIPYRCWRCWKRFSLPRPIAHYARKKRCRFCGHADAFFVPKDRLRAANRLRTCRCDAYWFPHRKNSGECRPGVREQKHFEWLSRWDGFLVIPPPQDSLPAQDELGTNRGEFS